MGNYFGTDGIRDRVHGPLLSRAFLKRLGWAFGAFLNEKNPGNALKIIIGRDTRASGSKLMEHLVEGLCAWPIELIDAGVVPTPGAQMLCKQFSAQGGIMLTASHNAASDNGVKLFDHQGLKLSVQEENHLEYLVNQAAQSIHFDAHFSFRSIDGAHFYVQSLAKTFCDLDLRAVRVVVDGANGAAAFTSAAVLEQLGAQVGVVGAVPDGMNINAGVGSEHPEKLMAAVMEMNAHVGIAHDGDADRLVLCAPEGSLIAGEHILGQFAFFLKRRHQLTKNTLITTVQSNFGLDVALSGASIVTDRVDVGDRNVIHAMLERGAALGGEPSGHFIFSSNGFIGDGLYAALMWLTLMNEGVTFDQARAEIPLMAQAQCNLVVKEKKPLETLPLLSCALDRIKAELGERGRVLVRYSGTEPKLRLLVEGPSESVAQAALDNLRTAAQLSLH